MEKLTDRNGKVIYQEELDQYANISLLYQGLDEENLKGAYVLAKAAKAFQDRFSEIRYIVRKDKTATPELKDRLEEIYKELRDIHTHCRMVWARRVE